MDGAKQMVSQRKMLEPISSPSIKILLDNTYYNIGGWKVRYGIAIVYYSTDLPKRFVFQQVH